MKYVHQLKDWPTFSWNKEVVLSRLVEIRHQQGRLVGQMEGLGFSLKSEASLSTITQDVLKTNEIEGNDLDRNEVRSSIARKLGLKIAGLVPVSRNVDGVVEMMLDATNNCNKDLTLARLFNWQSLLFPDGFGRNSELVRGNWRNNTVDDPMQVISGAMGFERVHFQAPDSHIVNSEMESFIKWVNSTKALDPVLKAAVAHLWFVTVHPFDDGNGRIARAIADMFLARADGGSQRFYSMSSQISNNRKQYYDLLEKTQKGSLDITDWMMWFLSTLEGAMLASKKTLKVTLQKAKFWEKHASTPFNKRQSKIINKLFSDFDGNLTSSKWAKMGKCSQDTAGRDINDLLQKLVLKKAKGGGRNTSYLLRLV
jgi:Fic family protein